MNRNEYKWITIVACAGLLFALAVYILDAVK